MPSSTATPTRVALVITSKATLPRVDRRLQVCRVPILEGPPLADLDRNGTKVGRDAIEVHVQRRRHGSQATDDASEIVLVLRSVLDGHKSTSCESILVQLNGAGSLDGQLAENSRCWGTVKRTLIERTWSFTSVMG